MKELLRCGYVARAHGLRGQVVVKTFDVQSTALFEVSRVVLKSKAGVSKTVDMSAAQPGGKGEVLVGLEGIQDRTEAESWIGAELSVFREDLEAPEAGQYFQGDLVGLKALAPNGECLGQVVEIWNSGPVPNLVIENGTGKSWMVPFAGEFVGDVDLKAGTVVVSWEEPQP